MFDHVSFSVNNYKKSSEFYDATWRLLGIERLATIETATHNVAGYGLHGKSLFWIGEESTSHKQEPSVNLREFHIAFCADSVEAIHAWYEKCIELGAQDSSAPAQRKEFHARYYAAYVIDPNGYKLEAVIHNYDPNIHSYHR